jgi:hypothetical protein
VPRDETTPYRASNGEVFAEVPAGTLWHIWWTCGAEARLSGLERDESCGDAQDNIVGHYRAGWDAMDERMRGNGNG